MKINNFNWKIGGPAGFGVMSSGLMFAKACSRAGLFIHDYSEYPSLIRGGHNTYQVYVSEKQVHSQRKIVDLLVALNEQSIIEHLDELVKGSGVICDSAKVLFDKKSLKKKGIMLFDVPFNKIAKEVGGDEIMRNTVTLGATMALTKHDFKYLEKIINDQFSDKDKSIASQNIKAARAGFDFIKENYNIDSFDFFLQAQNNKPQMVVTANDTIALGALNAGCKFYAAYPMTPASSILHTLAARGPKHGMVVRHAEDEISVINMAQGASTAGVRSMVATSGGGFALMMEGFSLAGITETALVVVEVMRSGPATGLPTWTDQGDLKFVLGAGHGEFDRVIFAPGDQEEAFYLTELAFNITEIIQSPVIVLSDKYISESHLSIPFFDTKKIGIDRGKILTETEAKKLGDKYKRYQLTKDGISPRALPGQEGVRIFLNSDEHDEMGYSEESIQNRLDQVAKRAKKIKAAGKLLPPAKLYGDKTAKITLVGWGSVKGPILDAMQNQDLKKKVNYVHFPMVAPLPANTKNILAKSKKIVLIETNSQAQFADVLRAGTGIEVDHKILRFDGRPFYQSELVKEINKI